MCLVLSELQLTVLRSWYSASNKIGYIVEGSEEVSFGNVTVYEGLVDAWPERS
jgi:beta-fructofuranosidase